MLLLLHNAGGTVGERPEHAPDRRACGDGRRLWNGQG